MRKQTILLTGGSGFIGRNIKESFLADKYEIIAPSSKELNCADKKSVDDFFAATVPVFDYVIHSATKPGHRNAPDHDNLFITNCKMYYNLEQHKKQYGKMLIMGSGAIYDMRNNISNVSEDEFGTTIPIDEHGFCKYITGRDILQSSNIYDLRIFGIFGKYEDYAIRFISNAICKTLFDLPITVRQNRLFAYLYAPDLPAVIDCFLTGTPSYHAYNITPDKMITLLEVADIVCEVAGKPNYPIKVANEGMGLEYTGSNARLFGEYSHLKLTPIREAIKELYLWYLSNKENINRDVLLFDK
ncbi:MAG: NAD(P)-dependent oxidoreductase [Bacteroidales bacterium]|jgi:GDP-L-fucose synthase|nr:NAD(P)-dependent oxidoreductase [Bacteroidales bacterium]